VTTLTPEPTEAERQSAREFLGGPLLAYIKAPFADANPSRIKTDAENLARLLSSVRSEARRTAIEEATGKLDRRADYLRDAFNDMDRAIELRGQAAVLRSLIELPATEVK